MGICVGGIVARPRTKPVPEPVASGGVRGILAEVLEEDATIAGIRELVLGAINAETVKQMVCPDCGSKFKAQIPDYTKAIATVIDLLEQNEGKATERPPEAMTVIIERPPLR